MKSKKKTEIWREYFIKLLNSDLPENLVGNAIYQKAEPSISDITQEKIDRSIDIFKN